MKKFLKQEKGITLISLAVAIVIMGIITTMLLYGIKDTKDVSNLTQLYSDIDNLSDKISSFYSNYGKIPAKSYSGLDDIISTKWTGIDDPRGANDTGDFLVIDLSAIDGLSLNYGRDYEKIKDENTILDSQTDVYVINNVSHNVFYLKGLKVENHFYYSNTEKDTEKVELKYVDGIRIFDGFSYKLGNKQDGLIIQNNTNNSQTYKWIDLENNGYTLSADGVSLSYSGVSVAIDINSTQNREDFLNSAKQNKGFYLEQNSGNSKNVLYFPINKWSQVYDTEGIYKDDDGFKAYIPAGYMVSTMPNKNTINGGLVIKNATNNREFVWIKVPENVLGEVTGINNIETELNNYVSRPSIYVDEWYDGCGITGSGDTPIQQYNNIKNAVLNSIKQKGGFWMSTDEIGSNVSLTTARENARGTNNGENINTDLLFGIQWDLACKFINENSNGDATKLNILNFDTANYEWTLEHNAAQNANTPTANNSVARAGSGNINNRTAYNYLTSNSNLAYRVMIY